MGQNHLERSYLLKKCKMRLEGRFCLTVHMCLKSCFPVDLSTKNIIVFLFRSGLKLGLEQDLIMFCCLTTFILLKFKVCQFLKMFENYSKCPIWIFEFWHFPPFFVPIKTDLSGNTVWPQASGFQKLAKIDLFWHFFWDCQTQWTVLKVSKRSQF